MLLWMHWSPLKILTSLVLLALLARPILVIGVPYLENTRSPWLDIILLCRLWEIIYSDQSSQLVNAQNMHILLFEMTPQTIQYVSNNNQTAKDLSVCVSTSIDFRMEERLTTYRHMLACYSYRLGRTYKVILAAIDLSAFNFAFKTPLIEKWRTTSLTII